MEMAVMVMSMKKHVVIVLLEIKVVPKETTWVKKVPFEGAKQHMVQRSKRSKVEMFSWM
jgi:hypothetical protein